MNSKDILSDNSKQSSIEKNKNEMSHKLQKVQELAKQKSAKLVNFVQQQPKERIALAILGLGVVYFFLGVFSIHFNISMMMILGSIGVIIHSKIKKAKKFGIINKVSPGLRTILMKRSIFDILCDLWYFPVIPLYIKAILGPFIFKKDPEVTVKNFDQLHPKFKQLVLTKGLINILPSGLKNFILPDNILDIDSEHLQESDESNLGEQQSSQANLSTRENSDTNSNNGQTNNIPYLKEKRLVHEAIEGLNQESMLQNQNKPAPSQSQQGSTELVICSQDVQDQIKKEKLLKYLQGNVQEKYYKSHHYHVRKDNKEKNSTFLQDPRTFLLKFLRGSKNVSDRDRQTIKKALLAASIILGTQLYFSKQSRQWLKYTLLFMVYLTSVSVSTGSFLLLTKHKKAQKQSQLEQTEQEI